MVVQDSRKILKINLLHEFITKLSFDRRDFFSPKIESLISDLHQEELTSEEEKTLSQLQKTYRERLEEKPEPLIDLRRRTLKRAFLRYRGLVFDLKTRFDYGSPQVALQDGLDLSEYVKEVIEEITDDLKQNLLQGKLDIKASQVLDSISSLYFEFTRERLAELYPRFVETLRVFQELLDDQEITTT